MKQGETVQRSQGHILTPARTGHSAGFVLCNASCTQDATRTFSGTSLGSLPPQSMHRQLRLPWEAFWTSHHRSSTSVYLWCLSVSHKSALPDLSNKCSGLKQMVKNLCTDANTKPLAWHHLWRRQISCVVIKRWHHNSSITGKTVTYLFCDWYIVVVWDTLSLPAKLKAIPLFKAQKSPVLLTRDSTVTLLQNKELLSNRRGLIINA